jgi:lysophospholipase L1-like esterase
MAGGGPQRCNVPSGAAKVIVPGMALRREAGDRHVPVNPQMIGSDFFAEDGFHPSSQGYRAWAQELAGPAARAAAS